LAGGAGRHHCAYVPFGLHLAPMLDPDRPRLAAHRASAAGRERLARREPHVALAMAVEMILALLGEELDRARIPVAGLERAADREIVPLAVERGRLAAEPARRVGVRGR